MGHLLLWIELLTANLLLLALLLACIGRLPSPGQRITLAGVLYLSVLVPPLVLAGFLAHLKFNRGAANLLFFHTASLAVCLLLGAMWLWIRGLRRRDDRHLPTMAATWPRVKLLVGWCTATVFLLATFYTLDFLVRREMAQLRTEAFELAKSVSPPPLPDEENAAVLYRQAFALFAADKEKNGWGHAFQEAYDAASGSAPPRQHYDWPPPAEDTQPQPFNFASLELAAFLEQHQETLALLRAGALRPGCYLGNDYSNFATFLSSPELSEFNNASRLLLVDASYQAASGHQSVALEDANALFQLSQHCSQEPTVLSTLISIAMQEAAIRAFERALAPGPVEESQLQLPSLQETPDYRQVFQRSFQGDQAATLSFFSGVTDDTDQENPQATTIMNVGPGYRVLFLRRDIELYRAMTDEALEVFELPYDQAMAASKNIAEVSAVTALLVPQTSIYLQAAQRADAKYAALELALALYRYQARHHRMPEKLEELSPDFLPELPLDPYDGQPVRVVPGEKTWIVYCLGPDGIDDGGTPFDPETKLGDLTVEVAVWAFDD